MLALTLFRSPLLCLFSALPLAAQDPAAEPTYGHSRHGGEFDEGPRQAACLMHGLGGHVHFPVPGLGAEAQRYFDQGVTQQHGFWYYEAERSFRQVALLQPDCAMAYWGMAMANVENHRRAAGFAAQAVQRAAALGDRERRYVDAIADYYQIDAPARAELQSGDPARIKAAREAVVTRNDKRDEKALARQLVRGFEAILAAHPDDVEARALLAIQSWRNEEHGIAISSHGAVDALLDQVFARVPLHPAHHYRIHLWDREKAERALASAAVNGDTAPAIAHQWHMSGHIYAKLERHAEAAWQQEASSRVDHAHMARDRVMPYEIHNYGHNQEWLCRSLSHVGRVRDAVDLACNMVELPRHPKHNRLADGRAIAGYGRARLLDLCEDHEQWQLALELERTGYLDPTTDVPAEAARLAVLGRASFRLGRLADGDRLLAAAEALLARARAERADAVDTAETEALTRKDTEDKVRDAMAAAGRERTRPVRTCLDLLGELRAERLLAQGDAAAALAAAQELPRLDKVILAGLHGVVGDHTRAVEVLQQEVKERPGRVRSLAQLVAALDAAGQRDEAIARLGELRRVAGRADLDLPALARLQPLVQAAGLPADWRDPQPFGADFGPRPDLAELGPFRWAPVPAVGYDLPRVGGGRDRLAARRGRPTLVVFYLGFGCLHCIEQLQAVSPRAADFAAAGIDIVAIGSDAAGRAAESLAAMAENERFAFPLLADAELTAFKAWRCHDDFEQMPLHGTFLVDADGLVRWQDIGFEPFTQVDWLLAESRRLLALPADAAPR